MLTLVLQKSANYSMFYYKRQKIKKSEWSKIAIYPPLACAVKKRAILASAFFAGGGGN